MGAENRLWCCRFTVIYGSYHIKKVGLLFALIIIGKLVVKGLRAMSDFEYEFQMALTNKKLYPDAETVFLTTSAENLYLSSSLVKMIASRDGDISSFVPPAVHSDIKNRLSKKG